MRPGDAPSFRPSLHTPDRQLNDLARDVGQLMGLQVGPPLRLDWTPGGPVVSLPDDGAGDERVLMRLMGPVSNDPTLNKWEWLEVEALADGTIRFKPGGRGSTANGYAVSAIPGIVDSGPFGIGGALTSTAVGFGVQKDGFWEWTPAGRVGPVLDAGLSLSYLYQLGHTAGTTTADTSNLRLSLAPGLYAVYLGVSGQVGNLQLNGGGYTADLFLTWNLDVASSGQLFPVEVQSVCLLQYTGANVVAHSSPRFYDFGRTVLVEVIGPTPYSFGPNGIYTTYGPGYADYSALIRLAAVRLR